MDWKRKFKKEKDFFQTEENLNDRTDNTVNPEDNAKKSKFSWFKSNKQQPNPNVKKKNRNHNLNIFTSFRRRTNHQILKYLEQKNVFNCLFYTDVANIPLILEQGIRPTGQIKLLTNQEYTVWTYLEHATYLELELGNSTRHFFWKWCTEQRVNLNQIAIISIDVNQLFHLTEKDWSLNPDTNRLQINESIPVQAIDWILIKDKKIYRLAKMYCEAQNLAIKLYEGHEGEGNS